MRSVLSLFGMPYPGNQLPCRLDVFISGIEMQSQIEHVWIEFISADLRAEMAHGLPVTI